MQELRILQSETDLTTNDISKMSDFYSLYIENMNKSLVFEDTINNNLLAASIDMLPNLIKFGKNINPNTQYIADFSALPKDVQKLFNEGKYKLLKRNDIAGNYTNLVAEVNSGNKTGKGIKYNLSLKEVKNYPNNAEIVKNILLMIQLKQINDKLDNLYDMMSYQNKMLRNMGIFTPFFEAVHYIGNAQSTSNTEDQSKYLEKAVEYLINAYEFASRDLDECAGILAQKTRNPVFRKYKDIRKYMTYFTEDLNVINKCVGIQLFIYKFQNKVDEAERVKQRYIARMKGIAITPIGVNGESALGILQDNYPYRKENKDMWFDFSNYIFELERCCVGIENNSKTYCLTAEI